MTTRGQFQFRNDNGRGGRRGRGTSRGRSRASRGPSRVGRGPNRTDGGPGGFLPRPPMPQSTAFNLDDIAKLIQQVNATVATLSNRMDRMEKDDVNKRLNRPTPASSKPLDVRPITVSNTTNPQSENGDFPNVCKCLYRLVQLQHHRDNWNTLPKAISERLQRFIDDINPPMPGDEFKKQLTTLTEEYASSIVQLVQQHIDMGIAQKEVEAGNLNRVDIDRATEVASKYLTTRLGKRLDPGKRSQLLKKATLTVGRLRQPPPFHVPQPVVATSHPSSPTQIQPDAQWEPVATSRPSISTAGSKRKAEGSANTTPTNNRFQVLATVHAADDIDIEPEDEEGEPSSSPPPIQHSAKKAKQSATRRNTGSGVKIFGGPKDDWTIQPAADTHTIVVGDSNLRRIKQIPAGWEIHCLPGAKFPDVTKAIESLPAEPKDNLTVIVQAGINHRNNYSKTTEQELDRLIHSLLVHSAVRRTIHIGISATPSMDFVNRAVLRKINDRFKHGLTAENCIEPLADDDVTTSSTDMQGIHYSDDTTDKIFSTVFNLDF